MRKTIIILAAIMSAASAEAMVFEDARHHEQDCSIEVRKSEMLSVADSIGGFIFSRDPELFRKDSHTYWLMNRMMQMVQLVDSAEDGWAWALAMDESVSMYNELMGREIGSVKAATLAVEELIGTYYAGNQPEMNTATYVESILELYVTVHRYQLLVERVSGEEGLDELCYTEYKAWFDLNNALNGIMCFHTYALATYTALPMDLNYTFGYWAVKRREELEIESDIFRLWNWKPFKSDSRRVSEKKFDKLVASFKELTKEDIIEEIMKYWGEEDYPYAESKYDEYYDEYMASEMFIQFEEALGRWRNVRKEIEDILPKEKRKSYRNITGQIHARLYTELKELLCIAS